jgi:hypothetical protein
MLKFEDVYCVATPPRAALTTMTHVLRLRVYVTLPDLTMTLSTLIVMAVALLTHPIVFWAGTRSTLGLISFVHAGSNRYKLSTKNLRDNPIHQTSCVS